MLLTCSWLLEKGEVVCAGDQEVEKECQEFHEGKVERSTTTLSSQTLPTSWQNWLMPVYTPVNMPSVHFAGTWSEGPECFHLRQPSTPAL